ncbi:unnamed protein product [Dibothriocephalus latus]|uniref:Uncharacterized protein n=1 Tax=Dibothriocephalus latus TaxID=60516 RepID=A0A3P6P002_DIBLA|nr:unnamed protein product [Dibothriocephalus latus]
MPARDLQNSSSSSVDGVENRTPKARRDDKVLFLRQLLETTNDVDQICAFIQLGWTEHGYCAELFAKVMWGMPEAAKNTLLKSLTAQGVDTV